MKLNQHDDDRKESLIPDYIPCEMFLETIGFFSPSSKRLSHITSKEKIIRRKDASGDVIENLIVIRALSEIGLPSTFDQDLYRAFLKICDESIEEDGRLPMPIRVPTKKLLRIAGKSVSRRNIKDTKRWFQVMRGTHIDGMGYSAETKRFEQIGTGVFDSYILRGQVSEGEAIATTNYVWVSRWFRNNYERGYTRRFDLAFYNRLRKPVAKALHAVLEVGWFATKGQPFTKSYQGITNDFLITERSYLADIKTQLEPAHGELEKAGLLLKWEYKVSKGRILITYFPGRKWSFDQNSRIARRERLGLPKNSHNRQISEQSQEIIREQVMGQISELQRSFTAEPKG